MKVLVTDSHTRTALYVIRSIGRRGIDVSAHVERRFDNLMSFGCKSRYVKEKVVTSTHPRFEEEYIQELSQIAKNYDVIIPIKTETIMAVAKNIHLFKEVNCFTPDYELIKFVQNKSNIYNHADKMGIPIPITYCPQSLEDIEKISKKIRYPVYIKLCEEGDFSPKERYKIANDAQQLIKFYSEMHIRFPFPIIQEKINGVVMGLFALFDKDSKPITYFSHRRVRQYPFKGGPSSCCESYKDPQVISLGLNLLSSLKWQGLAMVEFLKDERDGVPKLMEINPRFWGSTPLAINAGVDFPYLLFQASVGRSIKQKVKFQEGVKIRFLVNDLMALVDYMIYGENRIAFSIQFLRDLLNFKIKDGIIILNDIKPILAYMGGVIGKK